MVRIIHSGLTLRIFGAENVSGRITQWRQTTEDRIYATLEARAPDAVEMMRQAMRAAYRWGGKTAESLDYDIDKGLGGPDVRIYVNAYREVKYLTTLLPDSDFRSTPYPIFAVNSERLVFYGTTQPRRWVAVKQVLHPGFGRQGDVLRQSGEQALGWLGVSVEQAVRSSVAELQSGGRIYSLSRRR